MVKDKIFGEKLHKKFEINAFKKKDLETKKNLNVIKKFLFFEL